MISVDKTSRPLSKLCLAFKRKWAEKETDWRFRLWFSRTSRLALGTTTLPTQTTIMSPDIPPEVLTLFLDKVRGAINCFRLIAHKTHIFPQRRHGYELTDLTNLRLVSRQFNEIAGPQAFESLCISFGDYDDDSKFDAANIRSKLVALASGTSPYSRWTKHLKIEKLVCPQSAPPIYWEMSLDMQESLFQIQEEWLMPALQVLSSVEEVECVVHPMLVAKCCHLLEWCMLKGFQCSNTNLASKLSQPLQLNRMLGN